MEISQINIFYSNSNIGNAVIASYITQLIHPVKIDKATKVDERERRNHRVNETERVSDSMLELFIGKFLDLRG